MQKYHEMTICGLTRRLPICRLNEHLSIAGFVIFGDAELTVAAADALLKKAPDFDVIITAEAKGIPLAHEMSRQSGKKYLVARKYPKLYMESPVSVEVRSITTDKVQTLYLDGPEMALMQGKRVLLIDDVISTGESLAALEALVKNVECDIVGYGCILAEGDAAKRDDIFYLEELPLFFD
ncbi:MAG: adenine phosphoribosyltransferase [Ruminococcaceae bacterium]|nr:adenine phosphoribosyltransferase [Oscillospiraceae bacterium]MBQ2780025.1 adenine phosphoribosyltransferase [Clostridia bacterium]MBQ7302129.1 adenine phosphoribosyltransferase [Clostridia bacterium]